MTLLISMTAENNASFVCYQVVILFKDTFLNYKINHRKLCKSNGIFFLAIAVIWITIFLKFADDAIPQESKYDQSLSDLKGDKLSSLKVSPKNCLEF